MIVVRKTASARPRPSFRILPDIMPRLVSSWKELGNLPLNYFIGRYACQIATSPIRGPEWEPCTDRHWLGISPSQLSPWPMYGYYELRVQCCALCPALSFNMSTQSGLASSKQAFDLNKRVAGCPRPLFCHSEDHMTACSSEVGSSYAMLRPSHLPLFNNFSSCVLAVDTFVRF